MARAKNVGQGWHGQSIRHSNARLKGRAGGAYSTNITTAVKKTAFQPAKLVFVDAPAKLISKPVGKGRLYKLKKYGDSNTPQGTNEEPYIFTTKPTAIKQKSKLKQFAEKAGKFIKKEEQAVAKYVKKEAPILEKKAEKFAKKVGEKVKEEAKVLAEKAKEEAVILAQKAKEEAKKALEEIKNARSRQVDKIANELESIESVDEDTRLRLATMDVKQLTAEELKQLAIVEGESLFGGNKYENELKRRINEEARIETDLTIERAKAKEESRQRLIKPKEDNSESLTNFLFGDL